jgi:hypothetical protein
VLQKAKRATPAPEKLASLIILVNDLPIDSAGPLEIQGKAYAVVRQQLLGRIAPDWAHRHEVEVGEEEKRLYINQFERAGPIARQFIGSYDIDDITTALQRYHLLDAAKRTFYEIASTNARIISKLTEVSFLEILKADLKPATRITEEALKQEWKENGSFWLHTDKHFPSIELHLTDECEFEFRLHYIFQALQGVQAYRIRKCPICSRIFWAGRIDQAACSKQCNQTRRARIWRKNHQEKSRAQRFINAVASLEQPQKSETVTRYLVDAILLRIHDLQHIKPECQLRDIELSKDYNSLKKAIKDGFHPCPFCIRRKEKGGNSNG